MESSQHIEKIQKCLELARRAGTEAEAQQAMDKVQVLLVKHNLSLAQVESHSKDKGEQFKQFAKRARGVEVWHRYIYGGLSTLYFCHYSYIYSQDELGRRFTVHQIIGQPSNIAIIKDLAGYLIELGHDLSMDFSQDPRERNSFRKGFAHRINCRAYAQVEKAKKSGLKDEETGRALMVLPLYTEAERQIQLYRDNNGISKPKKGKRMRVSEFSAFEHGNHAGGKVSLSSNGIMHQDKKRIGA